MTKKPRLLIISHSPGLSGAERSLLETLELLAPFYELHLIIPGEGRLHEQIKHSHAPLLSSLHIVKFYFDYAHKATPLWRKSNWRLRNWLAHRKIVAIARSIKIEALYSNSIASWQGTDCARVLGVPHAWHLRELVLDTSIGVPLRGRSAEIKRLGEPNTVFLSNSLYVAQWYQSEFGISPNVAYQPIKVSPVQKKRSGSSLRLISVGRLHFEKRHHVVIDAIAKLPPNLQHRIRLDVYGDGPERATLQSIIDQKNLSRIINLVGFSENLQQEISLSDAVISTSVGEPFGRVTAEALLLGCPVIGVNSGGTAELLGAKSERGLLISVDDSDALAQAIVAISKEPEAARTRAERGYEWAHRTLSRDRYLDTVNAAIVGSLS